MAKVYVMDIDGGNAERYDAVVKELDLGGVTPAGARFHAAGPTPTGWRIIECWDDPAAQDRFVRERVRPITERLGTRPPRVEELDVDDGLQGRMEMPAVAMLLRFPGGDRAMFRAIDAKARASGEVPDGLIHHVNGPYPGGWYVVDLWATEEQRTRFLSEVVAPHIPADAPEAVFEVLPVHRAIVEPVTARA